VVFCWFPVTTAIFLYRMIDGWKRAGLQVHACSTLRAQAVSPPAWASSVSYLPRVSRERPWECLRFAAIALRLLLTRPWRLLRALRMLRRSTRGWREFLSETVLAIPLLRWDVDLVYFSFGPIAAKYASSMLLRPSVMSLRGMDLSVTVPANPEYATRLRTALRAARAVHCVSESLRREAVEFAGENLSAMHVIRTGIPVVASNGLGSSRRDGTLRIVSVARLHWSKGFEYGIAAVRQLVARGVPCTWRIVGDGPHREAVSLAIRDAALESVVSLEGSRDEASVFRELAASDVFLLCSLSEGISNAVLEALAAGIPAVATNVGGMAEAVPPGYPLLVPPRDPQAISDALERMAKHPDERAELGRQAREFVRANFSVEEQVSGFLRMFEAALDR